MTNIVIIQSVVSQNLPDVVQVSQKQLIRALVSTEQLSAFAKELAGNKIDPMKNLNRFFCNVGLPNTFQITCRRTLYYIVLQRPIHIRRFTARPHSEKVSLDRYYCRTVGEVP